MGYTYTLRDSGHRSQMVEQDGRTVDYSYDALYRLTEESISADPVGLNGTVMFSHDKVGNRLTRISTVTNLDSQNFTYDANDRLDSDTYDANGNTLGSQISAFAPYEDEYDFENRLVKRTYATGKTITLAYDADGNRIQKTILNSQFSMPNSYFYLVDRNNPTGYAQVVEELRDDSTGSLEVYRTYTYGLDLIAQHQLHHEEAPTEWKTSYYLYDGLGTVRALADENGAITDTYTYSAFGKLISEISSSSSLTPNLYKFTGEQWDEDLEMYFLRARYMDPSKGRFHNMDTFEGRSQDPITLHKYLYANANPVMFTDPTGMFSLSELSIVQKIQGVLRKIAVPTIRRAFKARTNIIYAAFGATRFIAIPHAFIYVKKTVPRKKFIRFDVGPASVGGALKRPFTRGLGGISAQEVSRRNIFLIPGVTKKIARLSETQYQLWKRAVLSFPSGCEYGLVTGPNCITWTIRAAIAARAMQKLPL